MELSKKQMKELLDNINLEIANVIDMNDLHKILNKSGIDFEDQDLVF